MIQQTFEFFSLRSIYCLHAALLFDSNYMLNVPDYLKVSVSMENNESHCFIPLAQGTKHPSHVVLPIYLFVSRGLASAMLPADGRILLDGLKSDAD